MKDKIEHLRNEIKKEGLNGYIIPTTDQFLSEYTCASDARLEYVTGFHCSNGFLVVFLDQIYFFTDPRYLTAATEDFSKEYPPLKVVNFSELRTIDYASNNKVKTGYDPKLFSKNMLKFFEKLELVQSDDLVARIWKDRPLEPATSVFEYGIEYSGKSSEDKIAELRNELKRLGSESLLLTSPDSVCWLLNLRARDCNTTPIMLSYFYIDFERIILFVSKREFPKKSDFEIRDISGIGTFLKNLSKKIHVPTSSNQFILSCINENLIQLGEDPVELMKALKNEVEIKGAKNAHIYDAIALIDFFGFLYGNLNKYTEYELGTILTKYRAKHSKYIMDSFDSTFGFKENGAKIHYKAEEKTSCKVTDNGILLIDSGGHYFGGTTDVTRTLLFGKASDKQKDFYTRVLKGHIALSRVRFPKGIKGCHIDILARQNLWDIGEDFKHGTGHGVGNSLSVHEGPARISLYDYKYELQEGMILSNEPGYYLDGEFGIRIENLQYVKKSSIYKNFYEFEQLTLVPYCKELIKFDTLSFEEFSYLREYYQNMRSLIYLDLSDKGKEYFDKEMIL